MITSIRLQNFKGHRDTTVPLGRLTVLVGPNGAGKTSVLEALSLQSRLDKEVPTTVFSGDFLPADVERRGSVTPLVITSSGTSQKGNWSARTEFTRIPDGVPTHAFLFAWVCGETSHRQDDPGRPLNNYVKSALEVMGRAVLYKLSARNIAAASYSNSIDPVVRYDGLNAAVTLASIKLGRDEDFARIEAEMREIIPNVERVRVKSEMVRLDPSSGSTIERVGSKVYFDFHGAPNVPAHLASEGTLITLAILTVLHGPNRPNVLLLDDFDQSLHPQAQIEMVRLLKRLLEEFPDVQIVATTHSPYILDELSPEDVVVFALRDDGTVATKRLSEHPQAAKMKDALSAGQLWSLDPEADWVPDEATAAQ